MQTIIDTTKGRAAQGVHRRTPNKWRAAFFGLILSSGLTLGMAGTAQAALSVSITGPANNTVTLAPANYTLTAIAANAQGAPIQSVAFYANNGTTNTLLGTIAAPSGAGAVSLPAQVAAKVAAKAPITTAASTTYTWNWSGIPMGIYSVTAVVTDKKGATATSAPVTLVADVPPTVNLTAPAANTVRTAPATFTLTADAAAPIGSIARVEFYNGTTLIGTATAAPYSVTWANVPYGTYSITAKATDNYGFSTTTAPVAVISNEPPTVNLTAPADKSSAIAPANISLSANANDIDGTIAKVAFYAATTDSAGNTSNTLVGTASSAPYSYAWSKVAVGKYTITSVATDNYGAQTTSAPVSITVKPGVLLPYYIHTDQLDTPRVITDTAGNTVWEWQNTDPFGNNVPNENPGGAGQFVFPLRFAGQYYDSETNLAYNVNRDYDPAIGRYIQSDPIGLGGGINTYGYVGGNPISMTDPTGLLAFEMPATSAAGGVAGATAAVLCVVTGMCSESASDSEGRKRAYEEYKDFQRRGYPRDQDPCKELRNKIDFLKKLSSLRLMFDLMYPNPKFPGGRHTEVNLKDAADIQRFEKEYNEKCKCKK